jgi:lipopolysaccharide export system protein LptC
MTVSIDSDARTWRVERQANVDAAFRAARRHSRLVRWLRRFIPIIVVGGIGLYALATWLNPLRVLANLPNVGNLVISGRKVMMAAPRLAGYTRDGRSYELTATSAAQDLTKLQFIELKDIHAKVQLEDSSLVEVKADGGLYDTKTEAVTIKDHVLVTSTAGTEVRLLEAFLDLRKGHIVSQKPVEVLMPSGRIDAQKLEITGGGDVVTFGGGVTMVVKGDVSPIGTAAETTEQQ